jgi:hypothetical protein
MNSNRSKIDLTKSLTILELGFVDSKADNEMRRGA